MDYNVLTKNDTQIQGILKSLDEANTNLDKCINNYQPYFNGDRFITDSELADKLKVTRRTLYEYRVEGKIPYINLAGKMLYRESDIEKVLAENYMPVFENKL